MEFTKSMVTMAEFSGEEHLFYSLFSTVTNYIYNHKLLYPFI